MEVIEHTRAPADPAGTGGQRRWMARIEDALHRPRVALAILLSSLLLTGLAWWVAYRYALDDARQRFERRADEVHARIERRMASYDTMLRGGAALFAAQPEVSREAWRRYVATVEPTLHYPGLQGFGVARLLAPEAVPAFERAIRAEGFDGFSVRPPGARALVSSIVYLEPFDARNQRAFGFDMLSEPTRRDAMLRARDSGSTAMSGIVTLVQEDGRDVQRGFLLYLPIRQQPPAGQAAPMPVAAAEPWGWVYAPFRVRDLMAGILGADTGTLGFRIHDGNASEAFYTTEAPSGAPTASRPGQAGFGLARPLDFGGRRWQVHYTSHDQPGLVDAWPSNLVALSGLSFDLLLFWSLASLARRKSAFEREAAAHSAASQARLAWLTAVSALSPDAVLVFERGTRDGEHRLVFTNPAFSQWFGLRPEDLLGLSEPAVDEWLAGLSPDGEAPMSPLHQGAALVTLAGPPRRLLQRGMREGERQRVYYFRDITHESEVDRLKNEFLTTAAHELRTPLASVYGFAELLADGRLGERQRQQAVQMVRQQASVLKHLVDELLDLSRLDAHQGRDLSLARLDLNGVARGALDTLPQAVERPRVRLQPAETPLWVDGDDVQLQQAVQHVLANGLKYSGAPAPVTLAILRAEHEGRHWALLRITDQGIGMSADQCAQAFERFYRADDSGHRLGAGLGLALVHEIVARHHGRVTLDSTPGAGTQATIWLPLAAEAAPA